MSPKCWRFDGTNERRNRTTNSSRSSVSSTGWFSKPKVIMSDIISNTSPSIKGVLVRTHKHLFLRRGFPIFVELRGSIIICYDKQTALRRHFSGHGDCLKMHDIIGSDESIAIEGNSREGFFPFKIKLRGNGKTLYFASETDEQRSNWILELNAARVEYGPLQLRLLSTIGVGHFGKVVLAQERSCSGKDGLLALKEIKLVRDTTMRGALTERMLLASLPDHPFVISLKVSFRYGNYLYYGFDFKQGADLFEHIRQHGIKMNLYTARFYMAQIVLALRHLHLHNIVYRDLKPENVLVDEVGNLCLADVGLSKQLPASGRTFTICGTRSYLAPEMIEPDSQGYGFSVDFWQLGCFLYELYAGRSPFWISTKGATKSRADSGVTAMRILRGQFTRPRRIDDVAWSLVLDLLEQNPARRVGSARCGPVNPIIDGSRLLPGWNALAMHPFFSKVNWTAVFNKEVEAPCMPCAVDEDDLVVNFSTRFLSQEPQWGDDDELYCGTRTELLHEDKLQGFGWTRPVTNFCMNVETSQEEKERCLCIPSDGTASCCSKSSAKFAHCLIP